MLKISYIFIGNIQWQVNQVNFWLKASNGFRRTGSNSQNVQAPISDFKLLSIVHPTESTCVCPRRGPQRPAGCRGQPPPQQSTQSTSWLIKFNGIKIIEFLLKQAPRDMRRWISWELELVNESWIYRTVVEISLSSRRENDWETGDSDVSLAFC